MKSFFRTLLAAIIANLLTTALLVLVIGTIGALALVGLISAGGGGDKAALEIPAKSILVLDLSMSITDMPAAPESPLSEFTGNSEPRIGLWNLTRAIERAATDKRIAGMLITGSLDAGSDGNGLAPLAELRRSLLAFRKKAPAKKILSYLEAPSLKDYYVATAGDEIWLNPYTESAPLGLAFNSPYFGNALKKFGVEIQIVKCGRYKSAVEMLTNDRMSDADREQRTALLEAQWNTFANDVVAARSVKKKTAGKTAGDTAPTLTVERLRQIAAEHPVLDAKTAVALGLVERTAYLDEVIEEMRKRGAPASITGRTGEKGTGSAFAQVNIRDYARDLAAKAKSAASTGDHVAIVYAEGEIVDSDAGGKADGVISGRALSARLRLLADDAETRAIVLRVNSPGGSAYASEVIQREMRRLAAGNKPVIVSFGNYAASGGYWIAAYGQKIYAERATITGSIGVFGILPNIQKLAASIGVTFDGVKSSPVADLETITRPKSPAEMDALQKLTDRIYDAFLTKVAEGRKLDRDRVAELAGGRVWSGADAKQHGLVDEIGGLRDAVEYAAKKAGLGSDYAVKQYPEPRSALESLLELFADDKAAPPIVKAKLLRPLNRLFFHLSLLNDPAGIYARLPWWDTEL